MKDAKTIVVLFFMCITLCSCINKEPKPKNIIGTWKMVYAEMIENDSLKIKNLDNTTFIKIINETHFSFFNQEKNGNKNFYAGAGTYNLKGNNYTEVLKFTSVESIKNHTFPFTIRFKGDTLIQSGTEEIKAIGLNRKIIEKYIRVKN